MKTREYKKVNQPTNLYKSINLIHITIDSNLQQRVKLDNYVIDDYADIYRCAEGSAYSEGTELPPITVWNCTEDNKVYLVDGFHRVEAAKQAGITELPFIEKSGTYREALLFSLTVNATHGLRRSNEDKRKAVMTLLEDSEWSQWSNVAIAKQCGVSESFVRKIKKDSHFVLCEVTTYTNKHGTQSKMNTANIGKDKSSESLPPAEDNQIISEQLKEDEVKEEENTTPHSPLPTPLVTTAELIDSTNVKPTKGKQKITNPLSVGDRVKVKDNHYFGGREGVVTQISSVSSLVVAFDNDQRELIRLQDLDLPSLSKPQKPQKKEILIKEGLNYKAGEGCKWYIEVEEKTYNQLQNLRTETGAITIDGALTRFLSQSKKQETYHFSKFNSPLKSLNVSILTLNIIQQYVNNHGEEALIALL